MVEEPPPPRPFRAASNNGYEKRRAARMSALGKSLESVRPYLLLVANRELDPKLQGKEGASTWCRRRFWKPSATSSSLPERRVTNG